MDQFRRVVAVDDDSVDLAEAALLLAAIDMPDANLHPYRRHLIGLATPMSQESETVELEGRIARLRDLLFDRHGYHGDRDDYEAIDNANLIRVIDNRRGIPVTLAILALHAARARGWIAEGLNFPGHFLIRLTADDGRVILDPFDRLQEMPVDALRGLLKQLAGSDAELSTEHYAPTGNKGILLRLQNNIVLRASRARDWTRVARAASTMIELAPGNADFWCQLAGAQVQDGQLKSAMMTLKEGLSRLPGPHDRERLTVALDHLRQRLN